MKRLIVVIVGICSRTRTVFVALHNGGVLDFVTISPSVRECVLSSVRPRVYFFLSDGFSIGSNVSSV